MYVCLYTHTKVSAITHLSVTKALTKWEGIILCAKETDTKFTLCALL